MKNQRTFSEAAKYELDVLEQALVEITDLTVNSFVMVKILTPLPQ